MSNELLERVINSPRLPSLPTIALEVIDLVQRDDVNINQIASTIQMDPALSGKILKTVNSSFYGQAKTIGTISQALVVLGMNSVKTLALGFSLINNLKGSDDDGFDHVAFWRRSLYTATAAKMVATHVKMEQNEEAFLGGLLHDMGMLALHQALEGEYGDVLASVDGAGMALLNAERDQLGLSHQEVGAELARRWKLPAVLIAPIEFHHDPEHSADDMRQVARAVALGTYVSEVFISDAPGAAMNKYYRYASQWFNLSREDAEPMLSAIHQNTIEMRRLFDLPTGDLGDSNQILASAHDAMVQITLENQQQTNELQVENEQLFKRATTDALTGAANRGCFNDAVEAAYNAVRDGGNPWTLIFFDADHFKRFNDTYGHQVGDCVLVELAKSLMDAMPDGALVARYGGEEFAVIVPDTDRVHGARLAEETRLLIQSVEVKSDDGEVLNITASIGVAIDDGSFFESGEQVVKAADQGVYAAKRSGRNCVRIFSPKPSKAVA